MTISLIGPAFGYLLGSAVLRLWVDIGWVDPSKFWIWYELQCLTDTEYQTFDSSGEITISPKDHNWVGAWWLGTLLCGILITITTIPIWFFPKKMKITNNEVWIVTIRTYHYHGINSGISIKPTLHSGMHNSGLLTYVHCPVSINQFILLQLENAIIHT